MNNPSGKELLWGAVTISMGIINAYLWKQAIFGGKFTDVAFYSLPVLSLFVIAILFGLAAVLIRQRLLGAVVAVVTPSTGLLLVPFASGMFAVMALAVIGGWYASEQIANEYAASNYFSVRKIFRSGLPIFFSVVALSLSVMYFTSASGEGLHDLLPKTLFDAVVPLLDQPLQQILPGFRVRTSSLDDLLLAFTARSIGREINLAELLPRERDQLLSENKKVLTEQFGITLTGKEKAGDVLYQITNAQIEKFIGPYHVYVPFIAAAGFFLAIKAFSWPVYWLTLLLISFVVKLLLATGVIRENTKTIEVKRLAF